MPRQVMIVDRSVTMRKIVTSTVYANVNDVVVTHAEDFSVAAAQVAKQDYHVLVFFWDHNITDDAPFLEALLKGQGNKKIPLVALFLKGKEKNMQAAVEFGITESIVLPSDAGDFADSINRVCNPVSLRQSKRYSLPGTIGYWEHDGDPVHVEVVNFSSGGFLCELDSPKLFNCATHFTVSLDFGDVAGMALAAEGLVSSFSSMQVISRNSEGFPGRIRLAFFFVNVPDEAAQAIARACGYVKDQEKEFTD